VKLFSSKRRIGIAAALVLLALFLLRPGASRLKSRIIFSISAAVGRPVDIGSVHLHLLPLPGFDLQNLVVYDDPSFGAEPMLRAGEVSASVRLLSLVRGRLEIARLDLTEPSLNLVHALDGRWNLEALLERTARIPLAPTRKGKSEPRFAFPYIEASSARINFKSGPEKKAYALTNADFSLWQDSENSWGVRLKAQPFRSDLNLSDIGLLLVSGTWQRSDAVRNTPLHFNLEWSRAQLGQVTKTLTGNDQGWRGEILLEVALEGTPEDLHISSSASLQDFRRYDITGGNDLRMAAHCDGEYSSASHLFHQISCSAPVARGVMTLKGNIGLPGSHSYDLVLSAENVPASAAAFLAQKAKSNLPDDLIAGGSLSGNVRIEQNPGDTNAPQFEGRGEILAFRLASAANKADIGAGTVPFLLTSGESAASRSRRAQVRDRSGAANLRSPEGPHLEFGPFPVAIGRVVSPSARGWVNRSGYLISISGEAEVAKALRAAHMFGLPALQLTSEGSAQIDLQIAGSWARSPVLTPSGFSASQVTGTARLHNVRLSPRGLGGPIEIISADMQLSPDEVRVAKLNATAAGATWSGWVALPRGCATPSACQVRFLLSANEIGLGELKSWISPAEDRPWYRLLEKAKARPTFLPSLRASGKLRAGRFQIQGLEATSFSANVNLDSGKLQISGLNANLLGGVYQGEWRADFTVNPSICQGSGTVAGASLVDVADAMNDDWISGHANASYQVKGPCPEDFWSSAEGALQFDMRDGTLPHVFLADGADALHITRLAGQARLHAGRIEVDDASLNSPEGKFLLSGTSSLQGELEMKLARTPDASAGLGYIITGTVEAPRVSQSPRPETEAQLKP